MKNEICSDCKNVIPFHEKFLFEYIILLEEHLNFPLLTKNKLDRFEKSSNIKLCRCLSNLSYKLDKATEIDNKLFKQVDKPINILDLNKKINIIKINFNEQDKLNLFYQSEKESLIKNSIDSIFLDYHELRMKLQQKNFNFINDIKEIDFLYIYGFGFIDYNKDFYYLDEQIIDILKYREKNGKTTYIEYVSSFKNNYFNIIKQINNQLILEFYKGLTKFNKLIFQKNKFQLIDYLEPISILDEHKKTKIKKNEEQKINLPNIEETSK